MRKPRPVLSLVLSISLGILLSGALTLAAFRLPREGLGPVYRAFLRARPPLPAPRELLLLEIDEAALHEAGPWPWDRNKLAVTLLAASELGAGSVLMDLPLSPVGSPQGAGPELSELRNVVEREFRSVGENVRTLFEAIRGGSIKPAESHRYVEELLGMIRSSEGRVLALAEPAPDGDRALAQALALHGRVWLGYGLASSVSRADAAAAERAALASSLGQGGAGVSALAVEGLAPPPAILLASSRGTGFSAGLSSPEFGLERDEPAVSATILARREGTLLASASLGLLADRLGVSRIELLPEALVLKAARVPVLAPPNIDSSAQAPGADSKPKQAKSADPKEASLPAAPGASARPAKAPARADLLIPLTRRGAALFDRPAQGEGGPRRLSVAALLRYRKLRGELGTALERLERSGYLAELGSPTELRVRAAALEAELLATGASGRLPELGAATEELLAFAQEAFTAGEKIETYAAGLLAAGGLSDPERVSLIELRDAARRDFTAAQEAFDALLASREELRKTFAGSTCVIALTAGGGTAAGEELGFLAAGLSASFLRLAPLWPGILLGALASALAVAAGWRFGPLAALAAGAGLGLGLGLGSFAIFLRAGTYLSPLGPALATLLSGLASAFLFWRLVTAPARKAAASHGSVSAEASLGTD